MTFKREQQNFPEIPLASIVNVNSPIIYGIVQPGPNEPEGVPFVQSRDLGEKIDIDKLQKTSSQIAIKYTRSELMENDILFSLRGQIGESSLVPQKLEGANISRGVARIRVNDGISAEYVRYALQAHEMRRMIARNANGSTFREISIEELRKLKLPIPKYFDQKKIAAVLRTWDEAIEKSSKLINLSKKRYFGLREQIINWNIDRDTSLGNLISSVNRPVPKPTTKYLALSIRSHGKGSYSRVVTDPSTVSMDTLYLVKVGDFIVNITFAWEGAVALIPGEQDGHLVSHRFPTYLADKSKVNSNFLRHLIRMPRFTYLLKTISPGGAGRNRVLNKRDFLKLRVPCPELLEQNRIAEILDTAEAEISGEMERHDALKRQKLGVMQKLLSGKWRINTAESDSNTEISGQNSRTFGNESDRTINEDTK